jgi:hypothetical protein
MHSNTCNYILWSCYPTTNGSWKYDITRDRKHTVHTPESCGRSIQFWLYSPPQKNNFRGENEA